MMSVHKMKTEAIYYARLLNQTHFPSHHTSHPIPCVHFCDQKRVRILKQIKTAV